VVFDIFYGFWKEKPGFYEVDVPRLKQVQGDVLAEMLRLVIAFYEVAPKGPVAAQNYLDRLEKMRKDMLDNLTYRIRGAAEANHTVMKQLLSTIDDLQLIIASSAVVLAACGCYVILGAYIGLGSAVAVVTPAGPLIVTGATAAQGAAAGWLMAVGATCQGISRASGMTIAKVAIKRGVDVGAERGFEKVAMKYETTIEGEEKVIEQNNSMIEKLLIRADSYGRNIKKVMKFKNKIGGLQGANAQSQAVVDALKPRVAALSSAARVVPLVFAAWELQDSVNELIETANRQAEREGDE
jgi:hypothetical protein